MLLNCTWPLPARPGVTSHSRGKRVLRALPSITPGTAAVAKKEISFRWKPIFTVAETKLLIT